MKRVILFCLLAVSGWAEALTQNQIVLPPESQTCTGQNVCTVNTSPSVQTPEDNKIILDSAHPALSVRLDSNPTTGYSWDVTDYDKQLLSVKKIKYVRTGNLIGGGGYEVWEIKAVTPGTASAQPAIVKMVYIRPWEKNQAPADSKTFEVTIQ